MNQRVQDAGLSKTEDTLPRASGGLNNSNAFQWAAITCLSAALLAAILTGMAAGRGGLSRMGLADTVLLAGSGGALLAAHVRSRAWLASACSAATPDSVSPLSASDAALAVIHASRVRRQEIGALLLVTMLGAGLRLLALRHSLWYDELWTMNFMRSGPVYALTHQGSYNNHLLNSFLGSLLLRLRLLLLGLTPSTGAPAYWVRLPSYLFGVSAIPVLYFAVREAIGKSAGGEAYTGMDDYAAPARPIALAAAFLLAASPAAVDLSAQTRGYAGVLFCGIAQAYFFVRALHSPAPAAWVGWLMAAFVGAFAHLYMLFIVFVNGLLVLGLIGARLARKEPGKHAGHLLEQGVLLLLAWLALTAVCYSGVIYKLREEFGRVYENGPMARAHEVVIPTVQLWGGLPTGATRLLYYGASGLLIALGLFFLARVRLSAGLYLFGMLIVPPLLVEAAHPHFVYPRFFAFALPAFLTLLACGPWQIIALLTGPSPDKRKLRLFLLAAGSAALLLPALPGLRDVLLLPKQDYKNAASRLRQAQREHTAVAVIGAGSEYFKTYGVRPLYPHSPEEIAALVKANGTLLVADTDIIVNRHTPPPQTTQWIRAHAGPPLIVFPGRFAAWPHRWLDGDSDVKIYQLKAKPDTQR